MIALLLACAQPPEAPADSLPEQTTPLEDPGERALLTEHLDAPRLLRRAHLDLLGVLPPIEDLRRVQEDPSELEPLLDALLDDPRLEERLVDLLAERWALRVDELDITASMMGFEPEHEWTYLRGATEGPARLAARIVVEDRPWTELVTTPTTMANEVGAQVFHVDYPQDAEGWQEVDHTDGRPAGGVLMSPGFYLRYTSTPHNYNRKRASMLSKFLVCEDISTRPVSFTAASTTDPDELAEQTRTNATCASCHSALDPLASALFGHYNVDLYLEDEVTTYHPERELRGSDYLGVGPAWFGTPLASAAELGPVVAEDERLSRCAVETFSALLWQREVELQDFATLDRLHAGFEQSGMNVRFLLRALLDTEAWRAGALAEEAPDEVEARTRRYLGPDQLQTVFEDLSGWTWEEQGWELLDSDVLGYRTMAGGVDGASAMHPVRLPTVSRQAVVRRLAQASAEHAVQAALVDGELDTELFPEELDLDDRPGEDDFLAAQEHLHLKLYGQPPTEERLELEVELWEEAETRYGPAAAWTVLVSGLLRDPRLQEY